MVIKVENKLQHRFKRRVLFSLTTISVAALIALSGCSPTSQTDSETSSSKNSLNHSTADSLSRIKNNGEIRIGLEGTYPPYSYHDETGALVGIEKEIGEQIATKLGVEAVFVETKWDSLIAGVDTGKYDIVINQIDPTAERKEKYDFTQQYTRSIGKIAVAKDSSVKTTKDLQGLNSAQTTTSNWARFAENFGMKILPTEGFSAEVELVASGRADATVNDLVVFQQYFAQHPDAPVRLLKEEFTAGDCCSVLLPKQQHNLLDALNEAISSGLKTGEYTKIAKKYLGVDISPLPADTSGED